MPQSRIAAQLYTLRDFTRTPADIAATLRKVRKIGYEAVQASGMGAIDAAELGKILRDKGLTCCATHTPLDRLKAEPQRVMDDHRLWECEYTAIGGYWPAKPSLQAWLDFADSYNRIAATFEGSGLRLGYHNHSHELIHYERRTALEMLLERLPPNIWMEIDTYWIAHGGADPAAWIARVAGRIPCVHLKDMVMATENTQQMAEVGEGNLNWPAVLKACESAGVLWYIIEQDVCQRDPFESLEISLKNLRQMGIS